MKLTGALRDEVVARLADALVAAFRREEELEKWAAANAQDAASADHPGPGEDRARLDRVDARPDVESNTP